MGHAPYLPRGSPDGTRSLFPKRNPSSMRRHLIDYYGTRSSDGTRSLFPKRNFFVHEATIYRLLRYSIFGYDTLPISQEDLFFSSARRRTIRLLRYSTYGWDMLPISQKDLYVHKMTIDRLSKYSIRGRDKTPISNRNCHPRFTIHRLLRS